MDRKCSANAISRVLIVIGIALVVFCLAQPGITYQGSVYNCGFPVTVKLDGDLSDWPADTRWHEVTYDMGWDISTSDKDSSLEFACAA